MLTSLTIIVSTSLLIAFVYSILKADTRDLEANLVKVSSLKKENFIALSIFLILFLGLVYNSLSFTKVCPHILSFHGISTTSEICPVVSSITETEIKQVQD